VKNSKIIGLLVLLTVYLLAFGVGLIVYHLALDYVNNVLIAILIADVVATLFVWGVGLIFKTASMYDPYWSVQPFVILLALMINFKVWDLGAIVLLTLVTVWSVRLTTNFVYTFSDLSYQDWRYTMLREKSGRLYPLVNLFGIHLFPTLVVFGCIYPMMVYVERGGSSTFSLLGLIGVAMAVIAILFETAADVQMQTFRRDPQNKGQIIRVGLWKHNRHPNYFGEILMWWGIYALVFALNPTLWFVFFGALINTLMFMVISIPMAERRLAAYKPGLKQYASETWKLFPIPFAKSKRKDD
jgi:steroid 5-alpha reductase family enzyme